MLMHQYHFIVLSVRIHLNIHSPQIQNLTTIQPGLDLYSESTTIAHLLVHVVIHPRLRVVASTAIVIGIGGRKLREKEASTFEIARALTSNREAVISTVESRTSPRQDGIFLSAKRLIEAVRLRGMDGIEGKENGVKGGTTGFVMIFRVLSPFSCSPSERSSDHVLSRSPAGTAPKHSFPPRFPNDRPNSPPSAPRGPRSFAAHTPPFSSTSRVPSARSVIGIPASLPYVAYSRDRDGFEGRDLSQSFDRDRISGPSRTSVIPRAPRSMRGSSSPVELRRIRPEDTIPVVASTLTVDLPITVKREAVDSDLEEGEVISPIEWDDKLCPVKRNGEFSPVKRDRREFWTQKDDPIPERNRWSSPDRGRRGNQQNRIRHSTSPQKRSTGRELPPWSCPDPDDGWMSRGRRRSASSPVDRKQVVPSHEPLRYPPLRTEDGLFGLEMGSKQEKRGKPIDRLSITTDLPSTGASRDLGLTMEPSLRSEAVEAPSTTLSRPDTPLFPPPLEDKQDHGNHFTVSPILPIRPDTPALPPPEIEYRPPTPAIPLSPDGHVSQDVTRDRVLSSSPAWPLQRVGWERSIEIRSMDTGGSPNTGEGPEVARMRTNACIEEATQYLSAHPLEDNKVFSVSTSEASSTIDNPPASALLRISEAIRAPSSRTSEEFGASGSIVTAISTNLERKSSPVTPVASTSPSDSTMTPPNANRGDAAEAEVIVDVSNHTGVLS